MKKIVKYLSTMALAIALSMGTAAIAFADVTYADRDVTVTGSGTYTTTDLFDNFKNVMPGDELTQPVTVENAGAEKVKVYLRAEAHDANANPMSSAVDLANQGDLEAMLAFLARMNMTITGDGTTLFAASPDQEAQLSENVLLCELAPGQKIELEATLSVPIEMGNEFADATGEVDWVFTVEEVPEPLPDTGLSQTGDEMPVMLFGGIALLALMTAFIALIARKRSRR